MKRRIGTYRRVIRNGGVAGAKDLNTQHYLRLLLTILVSFIATSVLLYPGKFLIGIYPFSYLGSKMTPSGELNLYARFIYDLGMALCGYTMYLLARYYHRRHPVPESQVYAFLSFVSSLGFMMMIAPCDVQLVRFIHTYGSGFVVGSHLFMASIRIIAVQHSLSTTGVFLLLFTLITSVLLYAALWFTGAPNDALFQKPAFAAIIFVEFYGSRVSRHMGEEKVFHLLRSEHLR
jgi:hypothetical protein